MKPYKRLPAVAACIFLLVLIFSKCLHRGDEGADPRGEAYAGAAACVNCHKNIYDSFSHTAHWLSSRAADSNTVKGSFAPPDNVFLFAGDRKVTMERRDGGLFQVARSGGREEAHRFDVVVGSGRKAQTYLYWDGDKAMQLPISYFVTEHNWANSPHFPADSVWFGRTIPVGCFECHSSYIQKKEAIRTDAFHHIDPFDRESLVYGIDCERCHGPAAEHAQYQQEHPLERQAKYITGYSSLSRQQRLDMCAVCHSGNRELMRSSFAFRVGDTLASYYYPESRLGSVSGLDVHGNQYQLLISSQCFLQTGTLDCVSCHDVHVKERDKIAVFSQRCMNCHKPEAGAAAGGTAGAVAGHGGQTGAKSEIAAHFCKMAPALGAAIVNNCIDCHMPVQASQVITMRMQGQKDPVANLVRNHRIAIYPEESKKFMELYYRYNLHQNTGYNR